MNIVTRALARRIRDRRLKSFIAGWDALEALVIRTYRAGKASPEDEREFRKLRASLLKSYPEWEEDLRPYLQRARIAQPALERDPFSSLLERNQAQEFVANWQAMQTLPAAREALNLFLLDLVQI